MQKKGSEMYESLTITVTCEGFGAADTELEDFSLAYSDAEALEEQAAELADMDSLINLISEYCEGYPKELIDAGKSDRFVDALRSMDFKKLKTLEFNYFTSDFEAPVEDPPLETTTNLAYDFETKSATYDYSED